MARIDDLRKTVRELYQAKQPTREEWCDWMYPNHVLVVADYAVKLAKKYGADAELSEVAALVHDIADVNMARKAPNHFDESMRLARKVMGDAGYSTKDIELVIEDAIRFHSCHGEERPKSKEGLVLATADSLAHLKTGFYIHAAWAFGHDRSLKQLTTWLLKKIDQDLYNKISFEDEREDARKDYEMLKDLFSRPQL